MKIFKFGGASVKDADAVRNVANILKNYQGEKLVVVISAMGKTTNALEQLVDCYLNEKDEINQVFDELKSYHFNIVTELFPTPNWVFQEVRKRFDDLAAILELKPSANADYEYDKLVCYGELLSTLIVSGYLNTNGLTCQWLDARQLIATDRTFREGNVNWELTQKQVREEILQQNADKTLFITQGFIGYSPENQTTTLGREGSDYTAGILAWCLDAESVTIWKDVPGMLNADPKWFDDTIMLEKISFKEALELSYYGATVIHPKTIKPLQNKNIALYVNSFVNPTAQGTVIQQSNEFDHLVPSFIFKVNQLLISIVPKDFSFVVEENLRDIFSLFFEFGVKINLMQNSALDFSVVVDGSDKAERLIARLQQDYTVKYNAKQELVTIRHYNQATIDRVLHNKKVLLEQRTRQTLRMVIADV